MQKEQTVLIVCLVLAALLIWGNLGLYETVDAQSLPEGGTLVLPMAEEGSLPEGLDFGLASLLNAALTATTTLGAAELLALLAVLQRQLVGALSQAQGHGSGADALPVGATVTIDGNAGTVTIDALP